LTEEIKKIARTELVFILDKSGSMGGLENDTIGGFNSFLESQKEGEGEVTVTTVLFSNNHTLLHDRLPIAAISPLTRKEYYVGGSTALLDAIGHTVNKIVNVQNSLNDNYKAQTVMVVIVTDGEENASREFSSSKVKSLIESKKEEGWQFVFLGANIDAVETGSRFGIDAKRSYNYHADTKGTGAVFGAVAKMSNSIRKYAKLAVEDESYADAVSSYESFGLLLDSDEEFCDAEESLAFDFERERKDK